MKNLLVLTISFLFLGCGAVEDIGSRCSGTHKELCHFVFGGKEDQAQNEEIDVLQNRINILELENDQILTYINTINLEIDDLETLIGTPIAGLQSIVNQNTLEILQLQSNHNVVKIVDPCGNESGLDEVFFKTSTGLIISSVSQSVGGLNTRFAILVPGNYTTTDGTNCSFSVNALGTVTPSVEY